ncbi:MAG TPA: hypothetical protein VMW52_07895 [Phycisphaerae bacterium]|nr:hypothetical protein [Phycisphaerae bacterium]
MAREAVAFTAAMADRIVRAVEIIEASGLSGGAGGASLIGRPAPDVPIRHGKVTSAFATRTALNDIAVNPCDQSGQGVDTTTEITVHAIVPTGGPDPCGICLAADDVVAYVPFWDVGNAEWRGILIGKPPHAGLFAVKVWKTGGDEGDKTNPCTFVYTVKDVDDHELGTGMTPEKNRPAIGKFTAPDDEDYGLGFYDSAGTFHLYDANEVRKPKACP